MKNIFLAFAFIASITLTFATAYQEQFYTLKNCKVISSESGIIRIEDTAGNIWRYEGNFLKKGEKVILKMYDNHTDFIEDDIIKHIERE